MNEVVKFKLCSYPLAIFESSEIMRKANKPHTTEEILKMILHANELVDLNIVCS